jgi:hypothetical protein
MEQMSQELNLSHWSRVAVVHPTLPNLSIQSLNPVSPHGRGEDVPSDKEMKVAMVQVRKNLQGAIISLKNVTNVS